MARSVRLDSVNTAAGRAIRRDRTTTRDFDRPDFPLKLLDRLARQETGVRMAMGSSRIEKAVSDLWRGGLPKRSNGSDCKSDGSAFAGSNPAPPSGNDECQNDE